MSDRFLRMDRQEFTDAQKLAIWERSSHRCEGCGRAMRDWEPKQFDHKQADALGGPPTVENGQVLGECNSGAALWREKGTDEDERDQTD